MSAKWTNQVGDVLKLPGISVRLLFWGKYMCQPLAKRNQSIIGVEMLQGAESVNTFWEQILEVNY